MPLTKLDGSAVTLLKWMSAQSGKVPSWKMVCAHVFMAKLSSRTPIRFIRNPVRTCKGVQGEGGFYLRPIIDEEPESQKVFHPRWHSWGEMEGEHKPRTVDTQQPSIFTCPRLTLKELKMSPFVEWFLAARCCAMRLS